MRLENSRLCKLCSQGVEEDIVHALLECGMSAGASCWLVECVGQVSGGDSAGLTRLDFEMRPGREAWEEAVSVLVVVGFEAIWARCTLGLRT